MPRVSTLYGASRSVPGRMPGKSVKNWGRHTQCHASSKRNNFISQNDTPTLQFLRKACDRHVRMTTAQAPVPPKKGLPAFRTPTLD
jgi:hypothetical protein